MESPSGKIFSFLCRYPTREFAYRELERGTGVSVATVSRNVKKMEEEGLLKTRKTTNAIFVSASLDNDRVIQLKRVRNLESLFTSGLVDNLSTTLRPDVL
ncbi:MAG: winged helix-turn-helix domain-containing protein, partial [Candidatus Undinarchaeales archaeon]|nr:winged helix-turn-helix domain-containing protein [Candidatus Undinarchaeales archaeon]